MAISASTSLSGPRLLSARASRNCSGARWPRVPAAPDAGLPETSALSPKSASRA